MFLTLDKFRLKTGIEALLDKSAFLGDDPDQDQ